MIIHLETCNVVIIVEEIGMVVVNHGVMEVVVVVAMGMEEVVVEVEGMVTRNQCEGIIVIMTAVGTEVLILHSLESALPLILDMEMNPIWEQLLLRLEHKHQRWDHRLQVMEE